MAFIYDKITQADPEEVNARYAAMLVKSNPKRFAIVEPQKEVEPVEVVAAEPVLEPLAAEKKTVRRRTKKK